MHRVDGPEHRPSLRRAHQRRQRSPIFLAPNRPIRTSLPGRLQRIEPVDQPQQLVGSQRRPAFDADDIGDAAQIFDMRTVELAGAVAEPQHMARGCPPAARRIAAGQRLLIGQQQRLVAGEDRRAAPARGGEAGRGADRLHMGADHPLRIGVARGASKAMPLTMSPR